MKLSNSGLRFVNIILTVVVVLLAYANSSLKQEMVEQSYSYRMDIHEKNDVLNDAISEIEELEDEVTRLKGE